jgi:dTMP kinase
VTGRLIPDRTYLVELDPETARARRADDAREDDRMETAGPDFYERVARAYTTLAEEHPDRIRQLDGRRSIEALHESIRADVQALLGEGGGTPVPSTGSSDS